MFYFYISFTAFFRVWWTGMLCTAKYMSVIRFVGYFEHNKIIVWSDKNFVQIYGFANLESNSQNQNNGAFFRQDICNVPIYVSKLNVQFWHHLVHFYKIETTKAWFFLNLKLFS